MPKLFDNSIGLVIAVITCIFVACQGTQPMKAPEKGILPTPIVTRLIAPRHLGATPTLYSQANSTELGVTPKTEINPDTGWETLRPGLERRIIREQQEGAAVPEKFYLVRVDPDYFTFKIGYHPGEPQTLSDWMVESDAFIVANGGFFTESNDATGLVVVDSLEYGTSYNGFGGMLAITPDGPKLFSLVEKPYSGQEGIYAGLQSFPMLVLPGNKIGYEIEDDLPARRTAIAQDREGRIVFILATTGTYTLNQLSQFLVNSDLNLELALNLDGGSSTGLIMKEPVEGVTPFTLLPIVITIHAR